MAGHNSELTAVDTCGTVKCHECAYGLQNNVPLGGGKDLADGWTWFLRVNK